VAGLAVLMACVRPGSTLLDFRDTYYVAAHNTLHGRVVLVEPLAAAVRTVARSGRGTAAGLLAGVVLAVPAVLALADLRTSRHTIVLLTIAIAVVVGIAGVRVLRLPWMRLDPAHGVLALVIVYVFTASPALMNMATWWGEPMSAAHVIAGEGHLYIPLLLGAVSVPVLRGTGPPSAAGMSTAPALRPASASAD
jgi:hypothetical protein